MGKGSAPPDPPMFDGPALTTLQASLDVADWSVARPRFAPGLSTTHGGSATGDFGVSRTGLSPAGCPQLVDWLRHHNRNLLVVMAPNLLDAPPDVPNCPTVPACTGSQVTASVTATAV
jgi:hypothetical protein